MGKKADYKGPGDRFDAYDTVVNTAGADRKGAKNPYTSRNGWMTSYLDPEGSMALRLSPEDRTAFIADHDSRHPVSYGAVMKDFVVVPESMLDDVEVCVEWFRRSWAWVGDQPPKPTKKPKKS